MRRTVEGHAAAARRRLCAELPGFNVVRNTKSSLSYCDVDDFMRCALRWPETGPHRNTDLFYPLLAAAILVVGEYSGVLACRSSALLVGCKAWHKSVCAGHVWFVLFSMGVGWRQGVPADIMWECCGCQMALCAVCFWCLSWCGCSVAGTRPMAYVRCTSDSKCQTWHNKTPLPLGNVHLHWGDAEDGRALLMVHLQLTRNKYKRHMPQVEELPGVLQPMVVGHAFICPGELEHQVGHVAEACVGTCCGWCPALCCGKRDTCS